MMIDTKNSCDDVIGRTVYDADGDKIGKVGQVYLDDETGPAPSGHREHRPVRHQGELRPAQPGPP